MTYVSLAELREQHEQQARDYREREMPGRDAAYEYARKNGYDKVPAIKAAMERGEH
jgi:hypothetical protein